MPDTALTPPARNHGKRFYAGLVIFVTGQALPLLIPFIRTSGLGPDMKDALTGLTIVGVPQVMTLLSVALLGTEGFRRLRVVLGAKLRRTLFPARVSRARYRVGVGFMVLAIVLSTLTNYLGEFLVTDQRLVARFAVDLALILGFVVLGGEFWGKFRALFFYDLVAAPRPASSRD